MLGVWTLVGLAFASQFYLSSTLLGHSVSWGEALAASLSDWYVWAALSVPILWLAHRFPPDDPRRWRTAAVHLLAAVAGSFLYVALRSAVGEVVGRLQGDDATFSEIFSPLLVRTFPFNLLIYGVIVALSHALGYYRKYHARTVQALELEKHLAQARLQALLHQLQPHFLFNTLNGIASLMYSEVDAADRMLVRLSELLRLSMAQTGAPLTPLRSELAFSEKYLEIEQIRFRGRLAVDVAIDADVLDQPVPALVLQPLVENAIRHGIEPQTRPGRVRISGRKENGLLMLTVEDNGGGLQGTANRAGGIGLANTRARLTALYGPRHSLVLENRAEGGCRATLAIPLEP